MKKSLRTAAFVGNPNCGKTTLFNACTGAHLKVANWPGVTVEKRTGTVVCGTRTLCLVDLPGTYSLAAYSMEEQVAFEALNGPETDILVAVADAAAPQRSLYLALQLLQLGKPMVLAMNMMDIAAARGMQYDMALLSRALGVPVVPISAAKKKGLPALLQAIAEAATPPTPGTLPGLPPMPKGDESTSGGSGAQTTLANARYAYIEVLLQKVLVRGRQRRYLTDAADRFLLHPLFGVPIFLCIMALVFFCTFTLGDKAKGAFALVLAAASRQAGAFLGTIGVNEMLDSLLVDGILAGVGGILTFLPNIAILFTALALLEDSGYMARIAYVMDGIMKKIGLSGRAFLPMVLGFGCSVPAVMATRTLENRHDRLKTILITPFMSCSARLPVYVLFSGMFFEEYAFLAAFSMYLLGIFVAIAVARIMQALEKEQQENVLLLELPEYKLPTPHTVFIYVWEKLKDYLFKAGTTIFMASIVLWLLLHFGPGGYTAHLQNSFGGLLGAQLVPLLRPIGLGYWQVVVALLAGIAAKEVVISACSVLFEVPNITSAAGMHTLAGLLRAAGFGSLNAYVLMAFCLLYVPCIATLAVIRRETGSTKWTLAAIALQLGTAWVVAFVLFRAGNLLLAL